MIAVLLALALQAVYYLVRIRYWCWVRPLDALRGTRDALRIRAYRSTHSSELGAKS